MAGREKGRERERKYLGIARRARVCDLDVTLLGDPSARCGGITEIAGTFDLSCRAFLSNIKRTKVSRLSGI